MSRASRKAPPAWLLYGASVLLHGALAVVVVRTPAPDKSAPAPIPITLAELAPAPPPPVEVPEEPPPPPTPEPPAPTPQPKVPQPKAVPPRAQEAPPPPSDAPAAEAPAAFADLDLTMGNGGGPGGVAVATGPKAQPRQQPARQATSKPVAKKEVCEEAATKPKPLKVVRPEYTEQARQAQVEGAVRVQVTIDEKGSVANVEVLKGLGFGLDEAAIDAIRKMSFRPGTRCQKPTLSQITFNLRFSLS